MSMAERIERREYKYLTDEATVFGIRQALRPFCELDGHAASEHKRSYTISSLYFDSRDFALYRANGRELVDRFKLRVRSYPQDPAGPVFFEVKRRAHDVIVKTRGRVARSAWAELIDNPSAKIPAQLGERDQRAVENFLYLMHTHQARPVAVVRYEREAWVSQIDDYARITFDRAIRSQPQVSASLGVAKRGWRYMDNPDAQQTLEPMTIVEFKFTSAVPRWMINIVQRFDLFRRAFSKYGTAIAAWHAPAVAWDLRPALAGGWV